MRVKRFVVVMAGGAGTRFWPRSRRAMPKQFLQIVGRRSMLQETLRRLPGVATPAQTLIVTGREHLRVTRAQAGAIPAPNLIGEPRGRSTAPCIALAAELIAAQAPDATMIVLPADHSVSDVAGFRTAIRRAAEVAEHTGMLVTLGVRPGHAETGYGYVEVAERLDDSKPGAWRVRAFHEKPDADTAQRYVDSGRCWWNAGMFAWRIDAIRAAIARHLPELARAVAPIGKATSASARRSAIESAYRRAPSISIDHGVLDHAGDIAMVEADFGWSDVGSWAAMPALWKTDATGNAARGELIAVDARGAVVYSPRRLVAVLGLDDIVVVDGGDAILVCARDRAQDVRRITDELGRRRLRKLL